MKNVNSKDPRKPAIVAALKRLTGASKVTLVKEVEPGVFQGECLRYGCNGYYERLGTYQVSLGVAAP